MQLFLQCLKCNDDSNCEDCCYFALTQYQEEEEEEVDDICFDEVDGEIELV